VIIGDRDHKETKGINEWAENKGIFLETKKDLKTLKLNSNKKIAVLSQTTQDEDFVMEMSQIIKKKYPQAKILETVCMTTHDRQGEVKKLAEKNQVVVVIGSPNSANSKRLWQIAKKINKKAYFIERAEQLKSEWFKTCKKIGVTAGASTPHWVISEVIKTLEKMSVKISC
jgi:4-hydroxy-3-methylbut-2-enyl diphosphate reductase